jgi:hypothetical protein
MYEYDSMHIYVYIYIHIYMYTVIDIHTIIYVCIRVYVGHAAGIEGISSLHINHTEEEGLQGQRIEQRSPN